MVNSWPLLHRDGYGAAAYGDAFADVYDAWFGDVSDAEAAAARTAEVARAAGGAPVLELGVGTGRVALPLTRHGVVVWGLDASAAMLRRLHAKPGGDSVRSVIGDMAAPPFRPGPRFAVVLIAYNTLFNLVTSGAQRECLAAAAALLARGGRVVVEAFVPDPDAPAGTVVEHRVLGSQPVVVTSDHDPAAHTITGAYESGGRRRDWIVRYRTPEELDAVASDAGLRLHARYAGWRNEPFSAADSPVHVSVYRNEPSRRPIRGTLPP
jgi:SAM-dependent methyltransferase